MKEHLYVDCDDTLVLWSWGGARAPHLPAENRRVAQIAGSCIRADQLAQAVKELRAHVERVASESDPIGAFRAKLRSS